MQSIITNYTFIPASKQIDFSAYSGFDIQKLKAVINITTNQLIYQSGNPTYGYSSFALNVLDLVYDTTSMNNSDLLQIYYDTTNGDIGDVGIQVRANATGAASTTHLISAATTNATIVKAGAGRVVGWCISNLSASWKYVKLHNQSTLPTAGAGVVRTIAIPPNSINNFHIVQGIAFTTGIGFTTVTGIEDNDTNPVLLSDLSIDIFYA